MHIVIIGNGITGITAARYIRKLSDHSITVISGETDHFFSRTALMYIYMGHMGYEQTKPYEDWFWEKNRIGLMRAWVDRVDTDNRTVITTESEQIRYDKLLIATGSKSNKFGWPGQDLDGVQGLYSYQDLELLETNTAVKPQRAVIVGGGLIGIELAEMLHSREIPVTLLVREQSYWDNVLPPGESALVTRHIRKHGFDLRLGAELKEILPDENGRVAAVVTKEGEKIDCQVVGLTAGVSPNVEFLKNSNIETDRGILVNHYLETSIPNVYAAGDCAQFREALTDRRPIEQVWYTGREQGKTLAYTMCGERKMYDPGYWFNSAKFIEIEYQTYGTVLAKAREGEKSLYWEHADGDKCVHMVYREKDGLFIGINTFGIRYRHLVFDLFLQEGRTIEYVLEQLGTANFDPEFFTQYESEVVAEYSRQSGKPFKLKSRRGLKGVLRLLKIKA